MSLHRYGQSLLVACSVKPINTPDTCITVCFCARSVSQLSLTLCDYMDYVCQAPLSMEFSRQEYWTGLPFPTPGDLSNPGIKPVSLTSPALAGEFFTTTPPGKLHVYLWLTPVRFESRFLFGF